MKRLLLAFGLAIFFLLMPGKADAAGVYFCRWETAEGACVLQTDQCGTNFKANCAQFTSPAQCQNNQQGEGNGDCVPDVGTPPSPPPAGSCTQGTCSTNADCGGTTCRGANEVKCTGVCACPESKCNDGTDCRGAFAGCIDAVQGQWCAGTCQFSEEDPALKNLASQKVQGDCSQEKTIQTAIGCIPYDAISGTVRFFIAWGLGVTGGVVILTIIAGAFQIMTSSGDPTKLNGGKELVVSALSGLLMLIFCIFLLRLIGVNVLGLF